MKKLDEPNPIRLSDPNEFRDLVAEVVTQELDKRAASAYIAQAAVKLPFDDRARFTEAVEIELMPLHEGNFAQYRVRPSIFRAWQVVRSV